MPRIAIEDTLTQVKDYLTDKGYELVNLNQQANQVDAIIISGQDKDMMGMQDKTTTAPVINANGLTPEQVHEQLSKRF